MNLQKYPLLLKRVALVSVCRLSRDFWSLPPTVDQQRFGLDHPLFLLRILAPEIPGLFLTERKDKKNPPPQSFQQPPGPRGPRADRRVPQGLRHTGHSMRS